jgi:hypothetical protein
MRLAESHHEPLEAHFTEGELDLEPPEEMAIAELDDEAILEEELDNEDLLEEDVDEDTLEASLEVLVHGDDEDDEVRGGGADDPFVTLGAVAAPARDSTEDSEDSEDLDDFGTEDREESLDLVLLDRLALVDDNAAEDDDEDSLRALTHRLLVSPRIDTVDLVEVAPRRSDEFVCRSCFLVRKRVQLVDAVTMACHDCSS